MEQPTETMSQREEMGRDTRFVGTAVITVSEVEKVSRVEPVEEVSYRESSLAGRISKRCIDIVLSLVCILVFIPVLLVVALSIKLDDGGSLLYFREIVGLQGRRFKALKFRTMIPDADAFLEEHPDLLQEYRQNMKLEHDPRITRIGGFLRRTSLDELPQLFNVLAGHMSLVGPRMIHPSELPRYQELAQKRLSVKPGVTGLWQLFGRQHDSLETRITLDMQYIDTHNMLLDFLILLKTVKVFVVQTGQ